MPRAEIAAGGETPRLPDSENLGASGAHPGLQPVAASAAKGPPANPAPGTPPGPLGRPPGGGAPADARAERPDPADQNNLKARVGLNIGIATGVLGVLIAVGFALLPVNTLPEKACVILACLALSVATVTGIGAWRNASWFAATAVSAGAAVVCLAALSMAAQGDPSAAPAASQSRSAASGGTQDPACPKIISDLSTASTDMGSGDRFGTVIAIGTATNAAQALNDSGPAEKELLVAESDADAWNHEKVSSPSATVSDLKQVYSDCGQTYAG